MPKLASGEENPKEILTLVEACNFTGLSKSSMYKLVHSRAVPYYKPNNKLVYFKRVELEEYLTRYRVKASYEIEEEAINYVVIGKKGGGKS